jgi:putative flippase GtrA
MAQEGVVQAGKFGLVGLASTIIDFALLNIGHNLFGLGLIQANLISTTVAMIFSFSLNRKYVFGANNGSVWRQGISFVLVTAFGLYIIQNLVIHTLSVTWLGPVHVVIGAVGVVGLGRYISDNVIITNTTKLVATAFSLVWNYIFYKKVVFI